MLSASKKHPIIHSFYLLDLTLEASTDIWSDFREIYEHMTV